MEELAMTDVIIIGAGPAGLTLGAELLRRGVQVRLFEQLDTRTTQSRALGLQSRTLELFEKMGVIEEFLKKGKKIQQANIYEKGKKIGHISLASLDTPYPFILSLPQAETEAILTSHFEKMGGMIERCKTLVNIDGLRAEFYPEESVSGHWIAGCDGAHSTVRHLLRAPFIGSQFSETFALADAHISASLSDQQTHLFFGSKEIAVFIPLPQPDHFRIITLLRSATTEKVPELNLDLMQKLIDAASHCNEIKIKGADWLSTFSVHRRIVPKMQHDHIFLVGDAAHIHSPAGGQGLNTCVQDAFNLAWKLALVHQGTASKKILQTYHQERHPIAQTVLKNTTRATHLVTAQKGKLAFIYLFSFLLNHTTLSFKIAKAMSELDLRYTSNCINRSRLQDIFWSGPKPGMRAPDVASLPHGKRLFHYLAHPKFSLLCFGDAFEVHELIQKSFSHLITSYHVSTAAKNSATIHDPGAKIASCYRVKSNALYLIRPDGVICYRSRSNDPSKFVKYLKKILSC